MKVILEGTSEEIKNLFDTTMNSIEQKDEEIDELKRGLTTAMLLIPPFNKAQRDGEN